MNNSKVFRTFHLSFSVIFASYILLGSWNLYGQSTGSKKWVGTWGTAPQLVEPHNKPPKTLTNSSLRQMVRVSIGGDSIRVKFSNKFSTSPVTMKAVKVAVLQNGHTIDTTTTKLLSFNGQTEVTMNSGAAVSSDPVAFNLKARMNVAITIYFGQTSSDITGHPGSRTTSYILDGDGTSLPNFTGGTGTDHWYVITGIDVKAAPNAAAVSILGNSITDGRGSTTNQQNRWPDFLSEALLKNSATNQVGVLNMGLGGNCVLKGGLGPTGVSRFERDVLNQQGIRWAIVFEGVNDIGGVKTDVAATSTANDLIAAYKKMIKDAHERNIWIYGATITPFKGNGYYNEYSEMCRNVVNDWIRNSGYFDAVLDFEKAIRNPKDTASLLMAYQNDGLHPDVSLFETMVKSIDLKIFEVADYVIPAKDSTRIK